MHLFSRKIFLVSSVVGRGGYGVIGSGFRSSGTLQGPYIGGGLGNSRGHVLGGDDSTPRSLVNHPV